MRPRSLRLTWSSFAFLLACGDGGSDAPPAFEEEIAEDGVWTFVPIEGSRCMDGSPTGIGMNLSRSSDKLVIMYEGGGACFNDVSCSGVAHQEGYREADLAAFVANEGRVGLFDRTDAENPARDWNYVFVPYCTGDIHAGNNEDGLGGRMAVGYVNSTLAITRVRDEFAGGLSYVLASGYSAGGFGAFYNYGQIQELFGDTPVDLLDDSGPPVSSMYPGSRSCATTRSRRCRTRASSRSTPTCTSGRSERRSPRSR